MELGALNLTRLTGELARTARGLALEPGAEMVARVVAAADGSGRGTIALAGAVVPARLPHGVAAGQTLRLQVVRADPSQVVVRIRPEAASPADDAAKLAQAAGGLAVSGDGDLLRAAMALAGQQPLWLPDGGAASVEVDPDAAGGGEEGAAGVAAFVLHSPELGAIEVRIALAAGGVRAGVVTPPGAAAARAQDALGELRDRLAAATGRPAAVAVSARPAGMPAPRPPEGRVDVAA
jgi:hypothetical protein